ncbi:hypothetical protein AVEN_31786-1 [Araneus ventricosus]|uniref:Uncharacterized protein n=1 Tax=Araneus ventricosus TaxID=182803 RepID=A0A4Y2WSY8_ARAVE|nr:hypothetical protein AVEN_31786-1 [Araneus ventricosus]
MPPKKSKAPKKDKKEDEPNDWKMHDLYAPGVSFNRIVTRSQTAFNRIKNSESDLDLFADPDRHQPPGQPHIMEILKGKYGAIPRTIITRSTASHLSESEDLCRMMEMYKSYVPPTPEEAELPSAKETTPDH